MWEDDFLVSPVQPRNENGNLAVLSWVSEEMCTQEGVYSCSCHPWQAGCREDSDGAPCLVQKGRVSRVLAFALLVELHATTKLTYLTFLENLDGPHM